MKKACYLENNLRHGALARKRDVKQYDSGCWFTLQCMYNIQIFATSTDDTIFAPSKGIISASFMIKKESVRKKIVSF
jgi:hypothetical protein